MNDIVDHYVDQFTALLPTISAGEPDWLLQQRTEAIHHFRTNGFPGKRDEDWRYMPMSSLATKAFDVEVGGSMGGRELGSWFIPELDSHRLVFIDGVFSASHSPDMALESGISTRPLAQVLRQSPEDLREILSGLAMTDHGFLALNAAFFQDGYLIDVAADRRFDTVIECLFVSTGMDKVGQVRNVLRLGPNARAKVIERHVSADGLNALVNVSTQVMLAPGAVLDYDLVEIPGRGTSMVDDIVVTQSRDSQLRIMTSTLGGDVVRNNLRVQLMGPGAHCDMLGLYVTEGRQHVDNHTGIVHAAPHCSSREVYKGVLHQRSRGVFHGRIRVEPSAVKTDATQANHNLLLSTDAEVDTKPQLEIYADDVKCAHGATVGQLDPNALFYLRSRGIDPGRARSLLTHAFVNEVLDDVELKPLQDFLATQLSERLMGHE